MWPTRVGITPTSSHPHPPAPLVGVVAVLSRIHTIIAERWSITAQQHAQHPQSAKKRGRPTGAKSKSSVTRFKSPGERNDAAYFTARIAVERPDILERMKAGDRAWCPWSPRSRRSAHAEAVVQTKTSVHVNTASQANHPTFAVCPRAYGDGFTMGRRLSSFQTRIESVKSDDAAHPTDRCEDL